MILSLHNRSDFEHCMRSCLTAQLDEWVEGSDEFPASITSEYISHALQEVQFP